MLFGLLDQMPGTYTPLASSGVSDTLQSASSAIWKLARQRACRFALHAALLVDSRSSWRYPAKHQHQQHASGCGGILPQLPPDTPGSGLPRPPSAGRWPVVAHAGWLLSLYCTLSCMQKKDCLALQGLHWCMLLLPGATASR